MGKEKSKIVRSQRELAGIFGVSQTTVQRWVRAGMPRTKERHYSVPAIRKWREETLIRRPELDMSKLPASERTGEHKKLQSALTIAKVKAAESQAKLKALEVARLEHEAMIRQGRWVSFENCQRFHVELFSELRRLMERIPIDGEVAFGGKQTSQGKFAKTWLTKRHEMILTQLRGVVRNLVDVVEE